MKSLQNYSDFKVTYEMVNVNIRQTYKIKSNILKKTIVNYNYRILNLFNRHQRQSLT